VMGYDPTDDIALLKLEGASNLATATTFYALSVPGDIVKIVNDPVPRVAAKRAPRKRSPAKGSSRAG